MLKQARLKALKLAAQRRVLRVLRPKLDPYPDQPDDIILSPSAKHQADYENASLSLSWRNNYDKGCLNWHRAAHKKLTELSGYKMPTVIPLQKYEKKHRLSDNLTRKSFYLQLSETHNIPVHLIYDSSFEGVRPVMLCLQGTNSGIHLSWGENRLPADFERIASGSANGVQAAKRGYIAVAIEQSCFGERRETNLPQPSLDPCIDMSNHSLLIGKTIIGERAEDISSVISWLEMNQDMLQLDINRTHIMGNSSGGTSALYAIALDPRIKAGLIGGCIGYIRETIGKRAHSSGQNVIPGILNWLEMDDIVALASPHGMDFFSILLIILNSII